MTTEIIAPADTKSAITSKIVTTNGHKVTPSPYHTTKDLDRAVARGREALTNVKLGYVDFGQVLNEIAAKELWKQRVDDAGKAVYARGGMDAFIKAEFAISANYARQIMDVTRKFGDVAIRRFGIAKLVLTLRAPEEEQKIIEGKLEKGELKSVGDVKGAVAEAKARHGVSGPQEKEGRPKGADKAKRLKGKKPKAQGDKITIALTGGRKKIELFCEKRPKIRARGLGDKPIGFEVLANGVTRTYRLEESPTRQISLIITTVRKEE